MWPEIADEPRALIDIYSEPFVVMVANAPVEQVGVL
jgi:hypothetical protein